MKTEDSPAPSQPATPAPTQTYTTQWASAPAMAIDPALQQQSTTASPYYSSYASHYPQAAYATHYQAYAPPVSAQTSTPTTQQRAPLTTAQHQYQTSTYSLGTAAANNSANAASSSNNNNAIDTADIATLNDALGSAGVDLRAEEESLQRPDPHAHHQHTYRAYEDRTRKQPPKPSFDSRFLGSTMRTIGTTHKITRIPEESVTYLALSLRARLQDLIEGMIGAANHRLDATFDRPASFFEGGGEDDEGEGGQTPMWSIVVRSDVAKQLAALEKIEREEETKLRKERKERAEMTAAHTAALAAQASGAGMAGGVPGTSTSGGAGGGDDDMDGGTAKKKRKKEGPGVTARNMSEDVRKKMSNAVATQAAGLGGKYSWMTAANTSTPPPKPKPTPVAATPAPAAAPAANGGAASPPGGAAGTWARPYVSIKKPTSSTPNKDNTPAEDDSRTMVTMRDAMFVIEKERGHGGGKGAARGWV